MDLEAIKKRASDARGHDFVGNAIEDAYYDIEALIDRIEAALEQIDAEVAFGMHEGPAGRIREALTGGREG